MCIITDIKPHKKNSFMIYIDEEYKFCLYKGEIKRFKLEIGSHISSSVIDNILDEVIYKRARERALYIIERSLKTEYEIRQKLKEAKYPDEIIERVIEMLNKYDFINDYNYAKMYIEYKMNSKSITAIKNDLYKKHISKEIISSILEESPIDESELIINLLKTKYYKFDLEELEDKRKVINKLMYKGFKYAQIDDAINKYIKEL